jgi:uncharacterized protein (DUF1697 family)
MPVYISLLRGINVGAHKRIKMEQLRASFEALELEQVKTYIQSGNVVFKTAPVSPVALSRRIEEKLLVTFGFPISVVSRTVYEVAKTIRDNPFLKDRAIDHDCLHVAFLSDTPEPSAVKKLKALTTTPDQSHCAGKEIYLYLPHGVSGSDLMKSSLDRVLAVIATTRNWRTVNNLHQMCLDCR